MAINLSDNIKVQAPKPADSRYLNITVPYSGTTHVNILIPSGERFPGLTVLINGTETGGVSKEYWYKVGVADVDLVLKSLGGTSVLTGATNGLTLVKSGTTAILGGILTGSTVFDGGVSGFTLQYGGDYSGFYTIRSLIDKGYADAIVSGLKPKQAVDLATTNTGPIVLSGTPTIDGVPTQVGMRILVKNQNGLSGASTNGVYDVSASGWTRSADFDGTPFGEVTSGSYMWVLSGNTNQNSSWILSTPDPILVGVTPMTFVIFSHVSDIIAGPGIIITSTGGTHQISTNAVNGLTATMGGIGLGGTLTGSTVISDSRVTTKGIEYGGNYSSGFSNCSLITKEYAQCLISTGGTYNLANPATKTVGGVTCGDSLTGKTAFQLLQDILAPELFPTSLVNPSVGIGLSPSGTFEIGCSIASLSVTATFNRGSISPQYCSASPYRSGCANAYSFTGCQMPVGFQACTSSPATETATAYSVISGSQTWCVCTKYDCGVQPRGSSNTCYCSPLVSGCSNTASATITGILPWYWGTNASCTITSPTVAGGTKVLAVVGSSTPITFNASAQFLWFAAPTGTYTTKTKWWVCAANAGNIGGVGELWATSCSVAVTSAQGCWTGCSYDVYVTCGITTTAAGIPMCLYF